MRHGYPETMKGSVMHNTSAMEDLRMLMHDEFEHVYVVEFVNVVLFKGHACFFPILRHWDS